MELCGQLMQLCSFVIHCCKIDLCIQKTAPSAFTPLAQYIQHCLQETGALATCTVDAFKSKNSENVYAALTIGD